MEFPTDEPFRIIAGPDGPAHTGLDDAFWSARRFRVGSQSNRMGLRLEGEPTTLVSPPERLSTPVAPGAVQVAGGQLIVLGVACGTMGGYPHVAHVISADLDRLGQLKPGDTVAFRSCRSRKPALSTWLRQSQCGVASPSGDAGRRLTESNVDSDRSDRSKHPTIRKAGLS